MRRTGEPTQESRREASHWVVDYGVARERAIRWLGERYLLAHPINRPAPRSGRSQPNRVTSEAGPL
jgi:hypothetical protein